MKPIIKVFHNARQLADEFAEEIIKMAVDADKAGKPCFIMLSGGSTPRILFEAIVKISDKDISWNQVHFFWGDERCVPPEDAESNFGMTRETLLDKIVIPAENIHRIRGENDPEKEATRYSDEIKKVRHGKNGVQEFDLVILGMGDDGHTASVFPDNLRIINSEDLCEVAINPYSGQQRITVTPRLINNAKRVVIMVTGKNKAGVLKEIIGRIGRFKEYPASYIDPVNSQLEWYLDDEAGLFLSGKK
jgi:6-phosphogluconolactonase